MQIKNNINIKKHPSIVSSKINLKRNIENLRFVNMLSLDKRKKLEDDLINYISLWDGKGNIYELDKLQDEEKSMFFDEELINKDFLNQKEGKFIILPGNVSIIFNNKDHINIYILRQELSLLDSYNTISAIENRISKQFSFAASTKYGYLTSSIKNCGLAMRVTVMVHLNGLVLNNKIKETIEQFNVRGYKISEWNYNNDSKDNNYFVVTTRLNFGVSEENLVIRFINGIENLIKMNMNGLIEHYNKNKDKIVDIIFRSYGILKYCKKINYSEALYHLTNVRTGLELGEKIPVEVNDLNKLFIKIKDGYVNYVAQKNNTENEAARAAVIKEFLN